MNKVAQNKKIIMAAKVMAKAVREEVEDILKDTEECVKKYIPARYVKASLVEVEKQLSESGIEAAFDKRVEKSAFKTTASQKPTGREIREVLNKVALITLLPVPFIALSFPVLSTVITSELLLAYVILPAVPPKPLILALTTFVVSSYTTLLAVISSQVSVLVYFCTVIVIFLLISL